MGLLTASLLSVVFATPRSRLLTLDLGGRPLPYRAGQAVAIGPGGSPQRRPYSIASAPSIAARTGHIELLVGADAGIDEHHAVAGAGDRRAEQAEDRRRRTDREARALKPEFM